MRNTRGLCKMLAWGCTTPGPGCDPLPSPCPGTPGPAGAGRGPESAPVPGTAPAGTEGQPGQRDSRDSAIGATAASPHPAHRQGGSLEIFKKSRTFPSSSPTNSAGQTAHHFFFSLSFFPVMTYLKKIHTKETP